MVKVFTGSLNYVMRTAKLLAENCLYVEIISQVFLRGSPVHSRGFTSEVILPGSFTAYLGTDFSLTFSLGKSLG